MTVGHCAKKFGWMGGGGGALQVPQQFSGKVVVEVQGACHLESISNIVQQYLDSYAFFHVHRSTKSQESPKCPKFSVLKFFLSEKMCMFYSSSWTIFLKFNRQAIQESQISAKINPPRYNIRVIFLKMFHFLQFHEHSVI